MSGERGETEGDKFIKTKREETGQKNRDQGQRDRERERERERGDIDRGIGCETDKERH